ncbi:MAG: hypothetical protein HQL36_00575 [Alphaproteobacteria bacterium]|nr:hypothetical protein [Alphaproteobacteria bacterium]MBF0249221.1 hypothetical protein [Alphaproteobacteria bacterium]
MAKAPPRIPVVKLIVWCLIIGFLLAMFNATPEGVYAWLGDTGRAIFQWLWDFGQSIGPYVLMGAMLVLPIWGVMFLWTWFTKR